jgi:hypothetical protein
LRFVDDVDQLLEQINVRQRVSRFDGVLIVSLVPGTQTAVRWLRGELKSASIAIRVAVSGRLVLQGTRPSIVSTTERNQVRIASAPMH